MKQRVKRVVVVFFFNGQAQKLLSFLNSFFFQIQVRGDGWSSLS